MNDSMQSRILQLRELRIAREKARLDKLREMNIKKYGKDDQLTNKLSASNSVIGTSRPSSIPLTRRPSTSTYTRPKHNFKVPEAPKILTKPKNQLSPSKPPSNTNIPDILSEVNNKTDAPLADEKTVNTVQKTMSLMKQIDKMIDKSVTKKMEASRRSVAPHTVKSITRKTLVPPLCTLATAANIDDARKTIVPSEMNGKTGVTKLESRKTIVPSEMTVKAGVVKSELRKTIVPSEMTAKTTTNKFMSRKTIVPSQIVKPQPRKTLLPSEIMGIADSKPLARKSVAHKEAASKIPARNSLMPNGSTMSCISKRSAPQIKTTSAPLKITQSASKANVNRESVFDRLYKQRPVNDKTLTNVQKLKTDLKFRDKVIKDSNLLFNKRHTVFEQKKATAPVRRSISAVHFKRIPKSELANCITKWSSSENLSKTPLKEINEDELVKQEKLVSAVKSERKKVTFQRPSMHNGPTTAELQTRLKNWLQKRGKSLDAYHHLQCFGIHHLVQTEKELKPYDDENKENIAVASDSDDDSYSEAMSGEPKRVAEHKWRRASYVNEFDDTPTSLHAHLTPTSVHSQTPLSVRAHEEAAHHTDELLNGALNDLTDLLREGFEWEQSARWLRAIRSRFPSATATASYWECRAALEERQGNLSASLQCWEEAIAKGTERTVVEANLDQLLDKFMKLNISPKSDGQQAANDKLIDVKNVFKSTIIRFAVQQAKLRQSSQHETVPTYTVTPVRRSSRLSHVGTPRGCPAPVATPRGCPRPVATPRRTPLVQICSSLRQIDEVVGGKTLFVPNSTLPSTP